VGNRNLPDYDKPERRKQYETAPGLEDFTENSLALGSPAEEAI